MLRLGIDVERALARPPRPEVAELMGTLHFWVLHTHPIAAIGHFYVVERSPPTRELLDWLASPAGIPRDGLRTFERHAIIDIEHGRELEELIDSLPLTAAHRELLALSSTTVIRQLTCIMEGLIGNERGAAQWRPLGVLTDAEPPLTSPAPHRSRSPRRTPSPGSGDSR